MGRLHLKDIILLFKTFIFMLITVVKYQSFVKLMQCYVCPKKSIAVFHATSFAS